MVYFVRDILNDSYNQEILTPSSLAPDFKFSLNSVMVKSMIYIVVP